MQTKLQSRGGQEGTILIMAVVVTVIIVLVIGKAATTIFNDSRQSQYTMDHAQALAIADGVTEAAQKRILDEAANLQPLTLTGNVDVDGTEYGYVATAAGGLINRTDADGANLVIQPYEVSAIVTVGAAVANSRKVVDLTTTPLFQYMIFYDDDLEILPGPDMTLSGRVHSNGSIYAGAGSTLTVDTNYFRCTGEILRERKDSGADTGGTVDIKVFEQSSFNAMDADMDSDNPDWLTMSIDTWQGTVQDGAHGVTEVSVPEIESIKAFDSDGNEGYFHENADLVIVDGQAFDGSGNVVALPAGTISNVSMYDGREGQYITVTQVDVGLLNGSGAFPANGLIYAYRTDASSAQPNGIRLANAAELAAPLSVVTEDPLFIQGDFNTVDKKAASVMADAVNLLSNAWDDSKSPGLLPGASATEYNVAVVTGNVPTPDGGGSYSGGFENLPRFHESWSGVTATIRGSFIKIFDSEIATSPWSYGGDVYQAPIRNWEFDQDFTNGGDLPPFTPNAVYVRRVMWSDGQPIPFVGVVTP